MRQNVVSFDTETRDIMTANDREALLRNELISKIDMDFIKEGTDFLNFKKGEKLLTKKSFRRSLFLIIKGSATVSKICLDGHKTVINRLDEGDVFGMATLFYEETEYPSEITAESPMRIAIFSKEIIEEAFEKYPEFAKAYAVLLSKKIHFLNEKLSAFSEGESHEKLLRWILSMADGREEFELPCSISKLASMVGIGRASVYRAFDQLSEEGKIKKEGKKIVILKP